MVDKETKRKGRNLNPEVYPFIQTLFADAIGETQSERAETAVLPAVVSLEMLAKTRSHLEIERKFLVTLVPENVDIFPSQLIRQGYLVVMPEAELRVRDEGGVKTLTRKEGTGLSRQETEVVLTNEQF
jgi:hypothetical protein